MAASYNVRFEPVGVEMDVQEGETVLEAGFRQGIALMHGCKEGQCSACKSLLVEGDIELLKHSTFALPEYERDNNHILLCRTHAYSDLVIELLNYDEDMLSRSIAVKPFGARVVGLQALTHDIRLLSIELDAPLRFWAGQYVDITLPEHGITRSFSMANAPKADNRADFIIKRYEDGAFSARLDGDIHEGDILKAKGPYGTCFRREGRSGPMVLLGGGSGMSPLLSILADQAASGEQRPVRLFYGARQQRDLFWQDEIARIAKPIEDFRFIPALSDADADTAWQGERGLIHDVMARLLREEALDGDIDAYACGPPPMIDAALPALRMAGCEPEHIHFDKFTPAARES
ncbi:FAD-binding oxidoreductase [Rhodopila sp.]|uniref:FAD-binding oxidoreductase n=1 Tax=Rhodopila sp. TaxID=2480087 RepID=UPI003D127FA0